MSYHEIKTTAFDNTHRYTETSTPHKPVKLANPLHEAYDSLKQTLLFAGLDVVAYNLNQGQKSLRLFELGRVYHNDGATSVEENRLGLWVAGLEALPNWKEKPRPSSTQTVYADFITLLKQLSIPQPQVVPAEHPHLAPGSLALTWLGPTCFIGEVHQTILHKFGIKVPVYFLEVNTDWLLNGLGKATQYQGTSDLPVVSRDISLAMDGEMHFATIEKCILDLGMEDLRYIHMVDYYAGDSLAGKAKSYTLRLVWQPMDKTLGEEEVIHRMGRVSSALTHLGIQIRE
jgi:phenylalanyl-tRNA synthetase beta chain